ncbi:MAG: hypothetical protein WC955_07285 [Elusimicrobiota bacterium]
MIIKNAGTRVIVLFAIILAAIPIVFSAEAVFDSKRLGVVGYLLSEPYIIEIMSKELGLTPTQASAVSDLASWEREQDTKLRNLSYNNCSEMELFETQRSVLNEREEKESRISLILGSQYSGYSKWLEEQWYIEWDETPVHEKAIAQNPVKNAMIGLRQAMVDINHTPLLPDKERNSRLDELKQLYIQTINSGDAPPSIKHAQEKVRRAIEQIQAKSAAGMTYTVFMTQYAGYTSYEVSLPHYKIKFSSPKRSVIIRRGTKTVTVTVREAGPWNICDNYWDATGRQCGSDLARGMPEAQAAFQKGYNSGYGCYFSCLNGNTKRYHVGNPAGLDATPNVAAALGLGYAANAWVQLEFPWLTPPPPAVPAAVSASDSESGYGVTLAWSAVSGATAYDVAFKSSVSGTWQYAMDCKSANAGNIGWPARYYTPGPGQYDFAVRAKNAYGVSAYKYLYKVTVRDQTFPAVPSGLSAQVMGSTSIKLAWKAVAGASGYTIYCSKDSKVVNDKCYKILPAVSPDNNPAWANLASITDGIRTDGSYAYAAATQYSAVSVPLAANTKIHKFNFRLYGGDNRIYKEIFPFWANTTTYYPLGQGNYRAYRTEGAVRLASAADVACSRVGVAFKALAGNTSNSVNHITAIEAHGGYLVKVAGGTTAAYTVNNLTAGTTYYFRIDAYRTTSPEVISYSCPVISAVTKGDVDTTPPGIPTLVLPANSGTVTTSLPVFDWSDITDVSGIKYELQIDSNTDCSSPLVTQQNLVSSQYKTISVLTNGTYYWRVRAVDGAGNTGAWSSIWSVIVNVNTNDTTPPSNPATVNAWADENKTKVLIDNVWQSIDSGPYLEWAGASDTGSGVSGYSIYWGTSSTADPGVEIMKPEATPVSYFATPAVSEIPYFLRIRTCDNAGNWSSATTLYTLKYDNTSPLVPELLFPGRSEKFVVHRPSFSWASVIDISGISYELQADNNSDFSSPELSTTTISTGYSMQIDFVDSQYYWHVRAKDGIGNTGNWSRTGVFYIDSTGPLPVTELTATLESGGDIKLIWPSAVDLITGVVSYCVYRSQQAGSIGVQINDGSEENISNYIDAGSNLAENVTYYYTIVPVDSLGNVTLTGNNQVSVICQKHGVSISGIKIIPVSFSPNYDDFKDSTTLSYTLSPSGKVTIQVFDGDIVVANLAKNEPKQAGVNTAVWDGLNNNKFDVEAKRYRICITAISDDGASSTPRDVYVDVDLTFPEISSMTVVINPFSPNNDGNRDYTTISYDLSEDAYVDMNIYDSNNNLIRKLVPSQFRATGMRYEIWDGKDDAGIVKEGSYTVIMSAIDAAGNRSIEKEDVLSLELSYGWIMGYVYNSSAVGGNILLNRISGAVCSVDSSHNVTSSVDSQQKGFFAFYGLSAGEYTVTVNAKWYEVKSKAVTVSAGKVTWSSIDLIYVGRVDNEPPEIQHNPITAIGLMGDKIIFSGLITDNQVVAAVKVEYKFRFRDGSESEFKERELTPYDTQYIGDILGAEVEGSVSSILYCIKAYDSDENESVSPSDGTFYEILYTEGVNQKVDTAGGRITIPDGNPDDGRVGVMFTPGALDGQVMVSITQKDQASLPLIKNKGLIAGDIDKPVAAYEFNSTVTTLNQPAEITLLYFDVDNDGLVDGTEIEESGLRIFWYDGNDWRYVGGEIDTLKNTVTAKVSHFSVYGLFPVLTNSTVQAEQYKPWERVITPNSDGKNDFACFNGINNYYASSSIDNKGLPKEVRIYDLRNRLIRAIDSIDIWDGKDNDGNAVESGVYIYQYAVNGKVVTGSIVVAK